MHAKYEVSVSYGSTVMAKGKVFATESQSNTQTKQKLDAPEFHSGGHKILKFLTKFWMLSKRYDSIEVDQNTWLHVPSEIYGPPAVTLTKWFEIQFIVILSLILFLTGL